MGYPLPEEPDVNDLLWLLVAIPNAVEYRRAAIGHLGELGKGQNWGEDAVTPASYVAAQSWLRAMQETYRLLDMGWPDLVLAAIDNVETLLANIKTVQQVMISCCGDNLTYEPPPGGVTSGDDVPQAVIDAGYATGVGDQDGYQAYKCMVAHLLINNFIGKAQRLEGVVQAGAALLSALLIIFGWASGLGAVAIGGLIIGIGDLVDLVGLLGTVTGQDLLDYADDLEADRDELVCAIMGGDGIEGSIAAYKAKLDDLYSDVQAGILKLLNVDHMFQHYLGAAYGNVDVAAQLAAGGYDTADYTCCDLPGEIYGIAFDVINEELVTSGGFSLSWRDYGDFPIISGADDLVYASNVQDPTWKVARSTTAGLAILSYDDESTGVRAYDSRGVTTKQSADIKVLNLSPSGARHYHCDLANPKVFVSQDDGVTGTWVSAWWTFKGTPPAQCTLAANGTTLYMDMNVGDQWAGMQVPLHWHWPGEP